MTMNGLSLVSLGALLLATCIGNKSAATEVTGENGADMVAADVAAEATPDTLVFEMVECRDSIEYKVKVVDYSSDEEPAPYTVEKVADTWEVNTLIAVNGPAEAAKFVNQWLLIDVAGGDSYSVHTADEVAQAYENLTKTMGVTDVRSVLAKKKNATDADAASENEGEMMEIAFKSANEFSSSTTVMWQKKNLLTLWNSGYDYAAGAAHGMPWGVGKTFDLKNLRILTLDNIILPEGKNAVLKILIAQLKKEYADVWDMATQAVDFPSSDPSLDGDGVRFDYGAYEIGAYAMGMPGVVIPYKKIKQYLTPEVKTLLEMK